MGKLGSRTRDHQTDPRVLAEHFAQGLHGEIDTFDVVKPGHDKQDTRVRGPAEVLRRMVTLPRRKRLDVHPRGNPPRNILGRGAQPF